MLQGGAKFAVKSTIAPPVSEGGSKEYIDRCIMLVKFSVVANTIHILQHRITRVFLCTPVAPIPSYAGVINHM